MTNDERRHTVRTSERLSFVDITKRVEDTVRETGVRNGRVTVFSPHTSCSLVANERESGLLKDILRALGKIESSGRAADTLQLGSSSVVVPVVEGKIRLGTWQRLLFVELGEPGERSVVVQTVGE